ncbi:MAG: hypothetical protein BMS9Abin25_0992 [Gammaproteobacteria bacterium]|nr:MAG: hypothetical protein BMS9Abin25_0992 [Gammaproteobacteria bacterium]
MMYKRFIILLASSSIFILSSCSQDTNSPEEQIRNLVSAMEAAVEQRSLDSVKELVDSEYNDEWNGSRRAALRALMFYFQGHQSIYLLTRISDIKLNDDATAASVVVYVGMAGDPVEKSESLIDLKADLYRFDIMLKKDDDEWLVSSAKWERARAESFGL